MGLTDAIQIGDSCQSDRLGSLRPNSPIGAAAGDPDWSNLLGRIQQNPVLRDHHEIVEPVVGQIHDIHPVRLRNRVSVAVELLAGKHAKFVGTDEFIVGPESQNLDGMILMIDHHHIRAVVVIEIANRDPSQPSVLDRRFIHAGFDRLRCRRLGEHAGGLVRTSRSWASPDGWRRGKRSPGTTYVRS